MTYIVMTASAKVPSSCRGNYMHAAIVELEPGFTGRPAMISARAKGVARIVWDSGACNVGSTPRAAFQQAFAYAETRCALLNKKAAAAARQRARRLARRVEAQGATP